MTGAELLAQVRRWIPTAYHDDLDGCVLLTADEARKHGRHSILIELSEQYCKLAAKRLSQLSLLTGAA